MKTGDIILFKGNSNQAKIIQKFQQLQDSESGQYNHSGLLFETKNNGMYVAEAAPIQQRKIKAAVILTPLDKLIEENSQVVLLEYKNKYSDKDVAEIILKYVGTPYDYTNLVLHQVARIITGKWIGRNKNADKRMVCHEFSMTVWNEYADIFVDCRKAKVSDMYYNDLFNFKYLKI